MLGRLFMFELGADVAARFGTEFKRIRAEAVAAERERIAVSFERSAQMLFEEGNVIGSRKHRGFATAIRARGPAPAQQPEGGDGE